MHTQAGGAPPRSSGDPTAPPPGDHRYRRLRIGNAVVGGLHLVQGVAILVLASGFAIPVTATFQDGPPGAASGAPTTLFEVRYGFAVAAFLLLAAADHVLMAAPGINRWYEAQLRQGRNTARWVEYSLSASLMIVLIAMLTGINSIYAIVALFGVNAAMIFFGLLMERANPDRTHVDWWPFVFGCFAGAVPWIVIAVAIIGAQVQNTGVPTFVFAIFISLFVLFNTFAVNQLLQYKGVGRWRNYLWGEGTYLVLSLVAKSALAWQVFGGTLAT